MTPRTIEEILEKVFFAHHDDISEADDNNIAEAKHAILELFKEPSVEQILATIKLCERNYDESIHNSDYKMLATAIHKLISTREGEERE
jgi:hypothetical protein